MSYLFARVALAMGLLTPAISSAQGFPVRTIDRPTAVPALTSVYILDSSLAASSGVQSSEHAATVIVGISDEVDLGVGLPPLVIANESEFGAPSVFASYGWDITNEWAVYPTIAYGFPIIAREAIATLTIDGLITFTPDSIFDFGLAPALLTAPDADSSSLRIPAYFFYQATDRLHVQLDGSVEFAGDSSGDPTGRGPVLYSTGLTWGYTLGRSDVWIFDIVASVARDVSVTDRPDYADAWRAGLSLTGIVIP